MSIFDHLYEALRTAFGSGLTQLELREAERLLEHERVALCQRVASYDRGLAAQAALCERARAHMALITAEDTRLRARIVARLAAGDRATAGRHALRLEELAQLLVPLRAQLAQAERAYSALKEARAQLLAAARDRLTALSLGIRELETEQAYAMLSADLPGASGSTPERAERERSALTRFEEAASQSPRCEERAQQPTRLGENVS